MRVGMNKVIDPLSILPAVKLKEASLQETHQAIVRNSDQRSLVLVSGAPHLCRYSCYPQQQKSPLL